MLPVGIWSLCSEACFLLLSWGSFSSNSSFSNGSWMLTPIHPDISLTHIFECVKHTRRMKFKRHERPSSEEVSLPQTVRSFPTGSPWLSTSKRLPVSYWWLCSLISSPDLSPGLQRPWVPYPLDTDASGKPASSSIALTLTTASQ